MTARQDLIQDAIGGLFQDHVLPVFDQPRPQLVWHYTTAPSLRAILRSRVLHLTAQPDPDGDHLEITWGRGELIAEARASAAEAPFSALLRMLDDPNASLFGSEGEGFVACFTPDTDQWSRRLVDAALVFDASPLNDHFRSTVEGHGLAPVQYGSANRSRIAAFLRAARAALAPLGVLSEEEDRLAAQCLMDIDVLSFFTKRQKLDWEAEWRLVKRHWAAAHLLKDDPRRVEMSIAEPACGLIGVILRSGTDRDVVAAVRQLATAMPYNVHLTCL